MYDDLSGKTALVTGSGQGIGRGIALALAAEGVNVAINVRSNLAMGEETVALARELGVEATLHAGDVADRDRVFEIVDEVIDHHGRIDILVNNAGGNTSKGESFERVDFDEFRGYVDDGLFGTIHCCQAVGRHLVEQRSGRIINITSISSRRPLPFWSGYSVIKQAVTMLTRELAIEFLEPEGSTITVNAIAPGLISTPRTAPLVNNEAVMARRLESIPMGRIGQPEDIATVALFLASERSGFMTGQELVVDGGEADYWAEMARWARS